MLCQICRKKRSSGHIVQIAFGRKYIDLYVCEDCAKALLENAGINLDEAEAFSFGDFLKFFFSTMELDSSDAQTCPVCGSSFSDFQRKSLLGCSNCYNVFKAKLEPIIINYQGSNKHIGKGSHYKEETPILKENKPKKEPQPELETLKKELKKAINEERYEDAATIRDKIKSLEKNSKDVRNS